MTALTPVEVQPDDLLALHARNSARYPFLLQSAALGGTLGAYDILFAFPREQLILNANGTLTMPAASFSETTFLPTLDRRWLRERVARTTGDLPFTGGWFLFLGYELAQEIEPTLKLPHRDVVARAVRVPAAIVISHRTKAAWIVEEEAGAYASQIQADLKSNLGWSLGRKNILATSLEEEPESRYLNAARTALEYIAAGDIYQANLSRAWRGRLADDVYPYDVFGRLKRTNPAPFAALATFGDHAVISSSPERLVEARGRVVSTRPIAGTRARRLDRADDAERLSELHAHPKERAEHVMLIDLERNDLGRVCEAGSVEVTEYMALESYAHVHHIVSNVRGRLRNEVTPGQLIAALFPGGTITGCPKVRCMEIIAELEQAPRGAYTGSMGYLNRDGSMDLNILIRTMEMHGKELTFRAGAGIVADSIPERELEETRAKARGLIHALIE